MSEGHYFLGCGHEVMRFPSNEEVQVVMASVYIINPGRYVRVYTRAVIHGTEYRVQDQIRRKFCNYIVFCRRSRFFLIERIFSYRYHGRLVAGFIGNYLENIGRAYRIPHMQRVVVSNEKHFVTYDEVISPGFYLPTLHWKTMY